VGDSQLGVHLLSDTGRDHRTGVLVEEDVMAHTPGPWQVFEEAALDYRPCTIFGAEGGSQVAMCCGGGRVRAIDKPEERANALLIAAAPELLEALKMMRDVDMHHNLLAVVDAAIAKATGRKA
jgi:hypothetical protein